MSSVKELEDELMECGITLAAKESSSATLKECSTLCEKYKITADSFVVSWLAYAATNTLSELSSSHLTEFERTSLSLSNVSEASKMSKFNSSWISQDTVANGGAQILEVTIDEDEDEGMDDDDVLGVYGQNATILHTLKKSTNRLKTSSLKSGHVGPSPLLGYSPAVSTPSEKYGNREKSGDIIFRYKCKDSSFWDKVKEDQSVWNVDIVAPTSDFLKTDYKYMFQKIKEVAMALGYLMEDTSKAIFDELDGDGHGRANLKDPSPDDALYLGKIRSDGKLTCGSVYFEGCLEYSDGHIVDLDLSALDEYYVFPGQIVVLEGKNDLGKCLRVKKIHMPRPLPLSEISIDSKQGSVKLNITVAVGPYTPSDSMQYEALEDLMKVVNRDKPDICILIGPFLEATHKMIENGEMLGTFEALFEKQLKIVIKAARDLKTKFILIPSFKDAHGHLVFPTPPYLTNRSEELDNVTVLPDPATVSINGVIIGMTSTDILMHLGKNELANSAISTDRMGRLSRHLLSQRNFYPLYPCDESVPLDVEHWIKYARIEKNPHILILPSDLRYFIKEVDGTIIVNPERLTKSCTGGTYGRIQVDFSSVSGGEKLLSVADFCVGEIIKI